MSEAGKIDGIAALFVEFMGGVRIERVERFAAAQTFPRDVPHLVFQHHIGDRVERASVALHENEFYSRFGGGIGVGIRVRS